MSEPAKIQFAFQGGGAKLIALLAVGEAIQLLQARGEIKVTRVAGTSAGSIVASLLAANISIEATVASLRGGVGRQLLSHFTVPGKMRWFYRLVVKGKPLWSPQPIKAWLRKVFQAKNLVSVRDLASCNNVGVFITKTNLGSRAFSVASPDEMLADALVDSCGLPYLLKLWTDRDNPSFVDGGISNNLPVKMLDAERDRYGEFIAVSFKPTVTDHPDGLLEFSLALLDSAIESTMSLTKQAYQKRLHEIVTTIGTFDFERALHDDFLLEYQTIKKAAIEDIRAKLKEGFEEEEVTDSWNDKAVQGFLCKLGTVYRQTLSLHKLKYESCRIIVTTHQGRPHTDPFAGVPDSVKFHFRFHTGASLEHCISVGIIDHLNESVFLTEFPDCQITDPAGQNVKYLAMPLTFERKGEKQKDRELGFFFTPPLPPNSGPFTVEYREHGNALVADLIGGKVDQIGYFPARALGTVDRVDLVLCAYDKLTLFLQSPDLARPGKRIPATELRQYNDTFLNMQVQGMRLENVDELWWVDVTCQPFDAGVNIR